MINRWMRGDSVTSYTAIIVALLAGILMGVTMFEESAAQNMTSTANQTAGNQTGTQFGNLTQADFEPVKNSLLSAREALQNEQNQGAFNAFSDASNQLFAAFDSQGVDRIKILSGEFKPVETNIEKAKEALINNDNPAALNALNSADLELLKITQQLPLGGTEEED
jgi:hypothetical protein